MKGLVCVKRVVDYTVKVAAPKTASKWVLTDSLKHSINPFCEIAVEEALKLREKKIISEITCVLVGAEKGQDVLRHALAMGADKAVHLKISAQREDSGIEPLGVAKLIQHVVRKYAPEIVFLGKQAIDDDCNNVGQMLAGLLQWNQATFASGVDVNTDSRTATVTREIDSGLQKLEVPLPLVITCDLRLNVPRYVTLPNLMKAKKKPIETIDVCSLGIDINPRLESRSVENPAQRVGGRKVKSVDELLDVLKNEFHAIN